MHWKKTKARRVLILAPVLITQCACEICMSNYPRLKGNCMHISFNVLYISLWTMIGHVH